jgi:hypothetical protein
VALKSVSQPASQPASHPASQPSTYFENQIIGFSQQPLVGSYSNFKLELKGPNHIL